MRDRKTLLPRRTLVFQIFNDFERRRQPFPAGGTFVPRCNHAKRARPCGQRLTVCDHDDTIAKYGVNGSGRRPMISAGSTEIAEVSTRGDISGKTSKWSGRRDSNSRPLAPHASALPGYATARTRERSASRMAWDDASGFFSVLNNRSDRVTPRENRGRDIKLEGKNVRPSAYLPHIRFACRPSSSRTTWSRPRRRQLPGARRFVRAWAPPKTSLDSRAY